MTMTTATSLGADAIAFVRARLDDDEREVREGTLHDDPHLYSYGRRPESKRTLAEGRGREAAERVEKRNLIAIESQRRIVCRYADGDPTAEWVVRLIAALWAAHPDYRDEWAPLPVA